MEKNVQSVLGISMDKIKEMVDVNTVIGQPIAVGEVTLIPISKVTYGFAGGGSDLPTKADGRFGGGSGAGITITPIAFLSVVDKKVQVLPINEKPGTAESIVASVPTLVDRLKDTFSKKDKAIENQ